MPAWIVLLAVSGIAVAALVVGAAVGRFGNRRLAGFAVAAGIGALVVFLFVLRSHSTHQAQAERAWAIVNDEQRLRAQAAERAVQAAANAIPDAALVEPPPRAPEPDDEPTVREAPPKFRRGVAPAPSIAGTPDVLPAWTAQGMGRQTDGEYCAVVSAVGRTADECWNRLYAVEIPMAVYHYASREIGGGWPYRQVDGNLVNLLVADQHLAPTSEGGVHADGSWAMQRLYVRLRFTPAVRDRLLADRAEVLRSSRVTYTAWLGVLACGALGVVFGYLKLDAGSDGVYTRRLRFAAIVLLLGLTFATCLLLAYFAQVESYGGILAAM